MSVTCEACGHVNRPAPRFKTLDVGGPHGAHRIFKGRDTRVKVTDTTAPPFHACASLRMTFKQKMPDKFVGTGFLAEVRYRNFRRRVLVTSAHNILHKGNLALKIKVSFGWEKHGSSESSVHTLTLDGGDAFIPEEYRDPTDDYDVALFDLSEASGLDDVTPFIYDVTNRSVAKATFCERADVRLTGYKFLLDSAEGHQMWTEVANKVLDREGSNRRLLYYKDSTEEGFSGSPVYYQEGARHHVLGVHAGYHDTNMAVIVTPDVVLQYQLFLRHITPTITTPQPHSQEQEDPDNQCRDINTEVKVKGPSLDDFEIVDLGPDRYLIVIAARGNRKFHCYQQDGQHLWDWASVRDVDNTDNSTGTADKDNNNPSSAAGVIPAANVSSPDVASDKRLHNSWLYDTPCRVAFYPPKKVLFMLTAERRYKQVKVTVVNLEGQSVGRLQFPDDVSMITDVFVGVADQLLVAGASRHLEQWGSDVRQYDVTEGWRAREGAGFVVGFSVLHVAGTADGAVVCSGYYRRMYNHQLAVYARAEDEWLCVWWRSYYKKRCFNCNVVVPTDQYWYAGNWDGGVRRVAYHYSTGSDPDKKIDKGTDERVGKDMALRSDLKKVTAVAVRGDVIIVLQFKGFVKQLLLND